jgi:phosphoribosyl-ATP pyrophosphohydrolase/phosphoribosyl-AMP cyclohydrolase/histidinol dehydrogenase
VAVIASRDADPDAIARSLLAEAEHDVDARAYLLCDDERLVAAVDVALRRQLRSLDTGAVARAALGESGAIVCASLEACADAANGLAVEHVELLGSGAAILAPRLEQYGALFVGAPAAFGDYGTGPNHTLPTGGTARFTSGLSVYDFLLVRPYLVARKPSSVLIADAALLAEAEGMSAHRAALIPARRARSRTRTAPPTPRR